MDVKWGRLVLVAAVLLVLLATWWFWWVPNWRPSLRPGETYGVDVSAHQGQIEWTAVASDGIDLAYIKATEGGDFVDDRFEENWQGAETAGLARGAYHFFTLCTSGRLQADNFLEVAPPDPGALAPAVDLELAGNCSDRPPAATVEKELDDFMTRIEAAWDKQLLLYLGNDWEAEYPTRDRLDRPLWLRRFFFRPQGEWAIWQLHGYAQVDGVDGQVDLNVVASQE